MTNMWGLAESLIVAHFLKKEKKRKRKCLWDKMILPKGVSHTNLKMNKKWPNMKEDNKHS
jgi:hypothetical protein